MHDRPTTGKLYKIKGHHSPPFCFFLNIRYGTSLKDEIVLLLSWKRWEKNKFQREYKFLNSDAEILVWVSPITGYKESFSTTFEEIET